MTMKKLTPGQKLHLLYVAERHRKRLQEMEARGENIYRAFRKFLKQDNFRGHATLLDLKIALHQMEVI